MSSIRVCTILAICCFAIAVASGAASLATGNVASADGATLRIEPLTSTVAVGSTFTVNIVQNAGVETSGTGADVVFAPAAIHLDSVQAGTPYATASLLAGVAPQTTQNAIDESNMTGVLKNLTVFFLPGAGSVPAGDQVALTLTFKGVSDSSPSLDLANGEVLDTTGTSLTVMTTGGSVTVGAGGSTPTPSPTATETGTATETSVPTDTPVPGAPTATSTPTRTATRTAIPATSTSVPSSTSTSAAATQTTRPTQTPMPTFTATPAPFEGKGSIFVVPDALSISPNTDFTLAINQNADFTTLGTQTNIEFDKSLVQVQSVDRGPAFTRQGAALLVGVVDDGGHQQSTADAIAEANSTGVLKNVTAYYLPGTSHVDTGENSFLIVKLKTGASEGSTSIKLTEAEMQDLDSNPVSITTTDGQLTVKKGSPPPPTITPVVAAASSPKSANGTPRPGSSTSRSSTTLGTTNTRASSLPRAGERSPREQALVWFEIAGAIGTLGFGSLAFELRRRRSGAA